MNLKENIRKRVLAVCVGVKFERKYRKGAMQRIDSFNLTYLSSIAGMFAICMGLK